MRSLATLWPRLGGKSQPGERPRERVEQVRPDGRPQAWPAGARGATEQRHHRCALTRRGAARRGAGEAAPAGRLHASRGLRRCGDAVAEPEAGGRHRGAQQPRSAARRSRRHGPRHAGGEAAAAAVLLRSAARNRSGGRPRGQRRHRGVRGAATRPSERLRHGADAGRQRGCQGAGAVRHRARLQGRADPYQRQRPGAVRPRIRAVLAEGRGAGDAGGDPSQRLHRGVAAVALLLQQRDRQSAGDHHRAALPDLRRRAGAAPQPEDPGRARRRLSRQLLGPHRPCLGRAVRQPRRPAASAHHVPAQDLFRHGGVHAPPAARAGTTLRCRSYPDGDGLSLRHGRLRSRGPRLRGGPRCGERRRHLRGQRRSRLLGL